MSEKHDAMWGAEAGQYIEQLEFEIRRLRALNAELVEACLWLKIYAEVQVRNHPDATDTPDWQRLLVALAKAQEQK